MSGELYAELSLSEVHQSSGRSTWRTYVLGCRTRVNSLHFLQPPRESCVFADPAGDCTRFSREGKQTHMNADWMLMRRLFWAKFSVVVAVLVLLLGVDNARARASGQAIRRGLLPTRFRRRCSKPARTVLGSDSSMFRRASRATVRTLRGRATSLSSSQRGRRRSTTASFRATRRPFQCSPIH